MILIFLDIDLAVTIGYRVHSLFDSFTEGLLCGVCGSSDEHKPVICVSIMQSEMLEAFLLTSLWREMKTRNTDLGK